MCGLVGMAGNLSRNHSKMFRQMLVLDTLRGWDSTGIAFVGMPHNSSPRVEKKLGAPPNLWDGLNASSLLDFRGISRNIQKVMIGHNRAATVGNVDEEGAHPFTFGHITGAHNGTLTDWSELDDYTTLNVDSQGIYNTIANKGIDHTWKNFLGAAALTWWDDNDKTLNLIRNEQRPLFVAWSESGDAIFWASEEWMITVAAEQNNVKLRKKEDCKEKEHAMISLAPHHLHTFKPTATSCPLTEVRELEKKKPAPTVLVPNSHAGGGASRIYRPNTRTSSNHKNGGDINFQWAQGLCKAPKHLRGQQIKLESYHELREISTGRTKKVIECSWGDSKVQIMCKDEASWQRYLKRLRSGKDYYFEITERPRIYQLGGKFHSYRVGCSGVKLLRIEPSPEKGDVEPQSLDDIFPSEPKGGEGQESVEASREEDEKRGTGSEIIKLLPWYGTFISERDLQSVLNRMSPKSSCVMCTNPVTTDQAEELLWLGPTTVCCPDCAKNEETLNTLISMNFGG